MDKNMVKALLIGIFAGFFSGVTLMILFRQIGPSNIAGMDDILRYVPFLVAIAVGFYASKLTLALSLEKS
jgi:TRAP-type C4-dicarboxylate transport system permease small subunit